MKRALLLCLIGASLIAAKTARADTFSFSFVGTVPLSGVLFSGNGLFDAAEIGTTDQYQITNVYDGSVKPAVGPSSAITGLLSANIFQGNDNILIYPGSGILGTKFFDAGGVSFSLANGNFVNLNDTLGFENAVAGPAKGFDVTELDAVRVSLAPTPEPSSLLMIGTGMLAGVGMLRRRKIA